MFELITGPESFVSFSFINFLLWEEVFGRDEPFGADVFALCCPSCRAVADGLLTSAALWEPSVGLVGTREEVAQAASSPHCLTRPHVTKRPLIAPIDLSKRCTLNNAKE